MKRNFWLVASLFCLFAHRASADTTLVFNEIMYHPNAGTNEALYEWIEFYNQLAVDLDISGWRVTGDIDFTFPNGTRVPGRSFVVLASDPPTLRAATGLTNVYGPFLVTQPIPGGPLQTNRLGNGGGTLNLKNAIGRKMDDVSYQTSGDWPVAPDGSGVSLSKIDRDMSSGGSSHWTASRQVGGTPGADNFGVLSNVKLIALDRSWKYEASGTDLGTGWRAAAFDDSAWGSRSGLTNGPIPTLFNTGLSAARTALPENTPDPHYVLTLSPTGPVSSNALAILNHPSWSANSGASTWIGVLDPGSANVPAGNYNFQTTFSLVNVIPSTVQITVNAAVDNSISNVYLNGNPLNFAAAGFASFIGLGTITSGFVSGTNTLEFRTVNADGPGPNPGGMRAEFTSTAVTVNPNNPLPAGRSTYYFRTSFAFGGNPQFSTLMLNPIVADGAVFYLNGVEVYRQNMPAGPISYATPALSDVATLAYAGPISIPTASLITGTNVLAVEVHQAAASPDGPVFGTELIYSAVAAPTVTLGFNELSPTTNLVEWLELLNYGTNTIRLDGMVIYDDATLTNYSYTFPTNTTLAPGAYLSVSNITLGFGFVSGDKLYLYSSNRTEVYDAAVVKRGGRARYPEGTGDWLVPASFTSGASNHFAFHNEIVINEIMYAQHVIPSTNNLLPQKNGEAWIELFNRSSNTVDLTGWELSGGISYAFPGGRTIAPGAYLVVAKDSLTLRGVYPSIDIIGDYDGKLSHSEDVVLLKDASGNPANKVHYFSGGRWPENAAGAGSSLELRDPLADNSAAEAWAASDESRKSLWQTYSYRMTAGPSSTANADAQWRDFVFGLLSSGECLIDDISVIQNPASAPIQFIDNGNFENGLTGWRVLGNHRATRLEVDPDNPSNHVLHIISTGVQEHMHNHIEQTFSGTKAVANGNVYEISFRARWITGNNLLNTRLYWDRCARTTPLPVPLLTGTPGARNSRYATNIGPTFAQFQHQPVVPNPSDPVTVSVAAQDPQGISTAEVWWSVNGGAWSHGPMTLQNGLYSGAIPAQGAGSIVQFYVRGVDSLGAVSTFPGNGPNSGALYKVNDGLANVALEHNLRIILTPANTALLHADTNVMSNDTLPCTVIYDERLAYYDMQVRLKSSERGRNDPARVGFHLEFSPHDLFRGVHPVMLVDRSGGGGRPSIEEIVLKHIALKAGVHEVNSDIARILAPQTAQNGPAILCPRYEDEFVDASFDNGGNGTLFELELTYYPTTTNAFGYKLPQPDGVQGVDFTDLGSDKEAYRYNFIIKNHRDVDDYSTLINFCKVMTNTSSALDAGTRLTMDVDEWMRTYALVSLCGVGDMYSFGNAHNFMTYIRPSDGKILYFPWDMDFSFTQGSGAALIGTSGGTTLSKVINLPVNLRRFYAHIQDIISLSYNTTYMAPWLAHYGPFAGQDYTGDAAYIQARGTFALNTISGAGGNTAFTVSGSSLLTNGSSVIAISGTAPVSMTSLMVNSNQYPIVWSSITAWTMYVPLSAASNYLSVAGYDLHGNLVSNLTRTVYYTNAIPDPRDYVMFSEIMFNPLLPKAGYVELFNASTNYIFDLSGWRIHGLDFTFPAGSIISNRQFIVVAESAAGYMKAYGAAAGVPAGEYPGSLQLDGETLTLIKPGATPEEDLVVDSVRYDGGAPWPAPVVGSSVQLVDLAQDNVRVANWTGSFVPAHTNDGWRFVSTNANFGGNNRMLIYLDFVGSILIDDISLVSGNVPATGLNFIKNGDFESPLTTGSTNDWIFGTNMTASTIVSTAHSGSGALRLVQDAGGSSSVISRDLLQFLSPSPTNGQNCTLSFWYFATNTTATNLNMRVVSSSLSVTTNITIFVIPPTNFVTPGVANFGAATLPAFQPLWLNEVQAENVTGPLDNHGDRDPWVELYNPSTNTVSLDGLYLSEDYSNLTHWAFPAGSTIEPQTFKVIWCDGEPGESTATEWHTSFRLPAATGAIALSRLYNGQPQVLDYINYRGIHPDRSYGSYPDGQPIDRQEFFYVTPGRTNNGASGPLLVYINEWMAANTNSLADPADGDYEDWFELYNPGASAVDIAGYYLTDTLTNKFQYKITTNGPHVIPAGGYLLVWADGETGQNTAAGGVPRADLHVNFKLNQTGEVIAMFAADGTKIDSVTFGLQTEDVSEGRYPDGSTFITAMPGSASPRAANHIIGAANTAPVLGTIGTKTVYVGSTLSFTATATDADAPAQTLTFTLDPGAPDGASITPGGAFSWTPISAGTYSAIVRVTDNGVPNMSDSETISINVYDPPRFSGPTRSGSNLQFGFDTRVGQRYRVEYKDNLSAATWTLLQEFDGTGGTITVTAATTGSAQRFYHIVLVP